jgi:hypothetical protein
MNNNNNILLLFLAILIAMFLLKSKNKEEPFTACVQRCPIGTSCRNGKCKFWWQK